MRNRHFQYKISILRRCCGHDHRLEIREIREIRDDPPIQTTKYMIVTTKFINFDTNRYRLEIRDPVLLVTVVGRRQIELFTGGRLGFLIRKPSFC